MFWWCLWALSHAVPLLESQLYSQGPAPPGPTLSPPTANYKERQPATGASVERDTVAPRKSCQKIEPEADQDGRSNYQFSRNTGIVRCIKHHHRVPSATPRLWETRFGFFNKYHAKGEQRQRDASVDFKKES